MLSLPWNEAVRTACSFLGLIQIEARFTELPLEISHILLLEIGTHLAIYKVYTHPSMTKLNSKKAPPKFIFKLSLGFHGSHICMEDQGCIDHTWALRV